MSNRKQREQNRMNALKLSLQFAPKPKCPNCGLSVVAGHYMPGGFGSPGRYVCEVKP